MRVPVPAGVVVVGVVVVGGAPVVVVVLGTVVVGVVVVAVVVVLVDGAVVDGEVADGEVADGDVAAPATVDGTTTARRPTRAITARRQLRPLRGDVMGDWTPDMRVVAPNVYRSGGQPAYRNCIDRLRAWVEAGSSVDAESDGVNDPPATWTSSGFGAD
ncbi:MAG TPA: hypothetical protein VII96_07685 [Acidimicrobiales bacterium]